MAFRRLQIIVGHTVLNGVSGSTGARWYGRMGTKTAYENFWDFSSNKEKVVDVKNYVGKKPDVGDYELHFVDSFQRHGSRTPSWDKDLQKWTKCQVEVNKICPDSLSLEWARKMANETGNMCLVDVGWRELVQVGASWAALLELGTKMSQTDFLKLNVSFRTSWKVRAITSGRAFLQGMLGVGLDSMKDVIELQHDIARRFLDTYPVQIDDDDDGAASDSSSSSDEKYIRDSNKKELVKQLSTHRLADSERSVSLKDDSNRIRFFDQDENMKQQIKARVKAAKKRWLKSDSMEKMLDEVARIKGCTGKMGSKSLAALFQIRANEIALSPNSKNENRNESSAVNRILQNEDVHSFLIRGVHDEKHYYRNGWGSFQAFLPYAIRFLHEWESEVRHSRRTTEKKFTFSFGHAETILPMLMFLGLRGAEYHASSPDQVQPDNPSGDVLLRSSKSGLHLDVEYLAIPNTFWDISLLCPFACHLSLVVWRSPKADIPDLHQILLNGMDISFPARYQNNMEAYLKARREFLENQVKKAYDETEL